LRSSNESEFAASFSFAGLRGGSVAAGAWLCGGAVFDVPRLADERYQLAIYS
jgi:hypothetical protein